jgi:hypothetical protein
VTPARRSARVLLIIQREYRQPKLVDVSHRFCVGMFTIAQTARSKFGQNPFELRGLMALASNRLIHLLLAFNNSVRRSRPSCHLPAEHTSCPANLLSSPLPAQPQAY